MMERMEETMRNDLPHEPWNHDLRDSRVPRVEEEARNMRILGRDTLAERERALVAADLVEVDELALDTQALLPSRGDDLAGTPARREVVRVLLEDEGARLVRVLLAPAGQDQRERRVRGGH